MTKQLSDFLLFTLWPTCDIQFKGIEKKLFMFQGHEKKNTIGETITETNTKAVLFPVIQNITHNWMTQRLQLRPYSRSTEFELRPRYDHSADALETF